MTVMQTVARRASQAFLNVVLPQRSAAAAAARAAAIPTVSFDDDGSGDGAGQRSSIVSAKSEDGDATSFER